MVKTTTTPWSQVYNLSNASSSDSDMTPAEARNVKGTDHWFSSWISCGSDSRFHNREDPCFEEVQESGIISNLGEMLFCMSSSAYLCFVFGYKETGAAAYSLYCTWTKSSSIFFFCPSKPSVLGTYGIHVRSMLECSAHVQLSNCVSILCSTCTAEHVPPQFDALQVIHIVDASCSIKTNHDNHMYT